MPAVTKGPAAAGRVGRDDGHERQRDSDSHAAEEAWGFETFPAHQSSSSDISGRLTATASLQGQIGSERTPSLGYLQGVARISYVDPASLADPELVDDMAFSQRYGTPRPETQSIRSHVPDVAKAFLRGWKRIFRAGIVEHPLKELCRVYVSESIGCEY